MSVAIEYESLRDIPTHKTKDVGAIGVVRGQDWSISEPVLGMVTKVWPKLRFVWLSLALEAAPVSKNRHLGS
jgi:hypothetical protein